MLQSPSFFVDLFYIASSDAQITKCVDASCGFGTAGVSETGLLELSTSSSWCSCSVRLFPPCCLQLRAEWAIRPLRQNSTHSSRASCKLFELFFTRFFLRWRGAPSSVCDTCLRTNMFAHFFGLRGRSAIPQGSNPDGLGTPCGYQGSTSVITIIHPIWHRCHTLGIS